MIRYDLKCDAGHDFDMWFRDSDTYLSLRKSNLVECPACGSSSVEKALMAPSVPAKARDKSDMPSPRAMVEKIRAFRQEVFANTTDVGKNFPTEARQMHEGEIEHRPIRGEATPEQAKEMHEDGVPILPVPPEPPKEN